MEIKLYEKLKNLCDDYCVTIFYINVNHLYFWVYNYSEGESKGEIKNLESYTKDVLKKFYPLYSNIERRFYFRSTGAISFTLDNKRELINELKSLLQTETSTPRNTDEVISMCCVCHEDIDKQTLHILYPCGHTSLCTKCYVGKKCYICDKETTDRIKVYL